MPVPAHAPRAPAGIFYGPLTDRAGTGGRRCACSVRFVTSLGPGGRTGRWGQASGRTLASALQAARVIQRAASTSRGEDMP